MDWIIYAINESRYWLMPLTLGICVVLLAAEICGLIVSFSREIDGDEP
jgi:hypothetical protein